jgi:hypothetical protein
MTLLALVLAPFIPVHAAAPVGELEVRLDAAGKPCFTISEREQGRHGAPNFQAIAVQEAGGANAPMWKMVMPRQRTFALASYMCVPYAGRPPVLPQTPARVLQAHRAYEVTVTVHPATALSPRLYRSRFCVSAKGWAVNVAVPDESGVCPR